MSETKEKLSTYYKNLIKEIEENQMKSFWIFCNKEKLIKKETSKKQKLKEYIKGKKQLWNKRIASINLLYSVSPDKIDASKLDKDVFTIKIYIYNINNQGDFDYDDINTWSLVVNYTKNEFDTKRPSYDKLIDIIKQMVKLAEKQKIITDFVGISYTEFFNAYDKLKKK